MNTAPTGDCQRRGEVATPAAATMPLEIADGHWREVSLYMHRLPTTLASVRVNGRMVKVPARFQEVYWRASHEWGTFFLRDDIARRQPIDILSLLAMVPGVQPHGGSFSFARCDRLLTIPGAILSAKVQVYVDGLRRTGSAGETDVLKALKEVSISDVEAVEVYRGVAQIPGEFLDDACAVVAIWTKRY